MVYKEALDGHKALTSRRKSTATRLSKICAAFSQDNFFHDRQISVFTAGSIGRGDSGKNSDLDLFVISEKRDDQRGRLADLEVLAKLIEINRKLKYPPFSNDGEYLKVYSIVEMKNALGHPRDDSENLFTARMLLLLESKPICNETLYEKHVASIVGHYFRDQRGHKLFKPLFLLNDVLRYWRTLCLNYERTRNDPDKPWRKKNINLKFSRMLTVFGSVLPLISIPVKSPNGVIELISLTPLERLARGLDSLSDDNLLDDFIQFLDDYETFLQWKEDPDVEKQMKKSKKKDESRSRAVRFSDFLLKAVSHRSISEEYRKYLVI